MYLAKSLKYPPTAECYPLWSHNCRSATETRGCALGTHASCTDWWAAKTLGPMSWSPPQCRRHAATFGRAYGWRPNPQSISYIETVLIPNPTRMSIIPNNSPAISVHLIGESRMIRIQFGAVRQNLVGKTIQIANASRKPWHHWLSVQIFTRNNTKVGADLLQFLNGRAQLSRFVVTLDQELVAGQTIRRARFNVNKIDMVLVEDAQRIGQGSAALVVVQREDEACVLGAIGVFLNVGSSARQQGLNEFEKKNIKAEYLNSYYICKS